MSSIREIKQDIREEVLSIRAQMPEETWQQKSDSIIARLKETDFFQKADTVHTYISMNKRREVCTDQLLNYLLESGKKVVVPITNFSNGTLSHTEIDKTSDLETNKWGVSEPRTFNPVDVDELDVVIIPMAAADKSGNRLGYGKGFYDRFLSETKAKKVGLVFDEFLFDEIPVEEFDVKLDVIITEERVILA